MAKQLTCSECGKPLTGQQKFTCGSSCRKKRSDRRKRENKLRRQQQAERQSLPEHLKTVSESVRKEARDVGHQILKEELRPVVREAITADVLQGIGDLVRLTPRMVELIEQDMESGDAAVRQKAYTLLARYTLGNASVAPASAEQQPAPMQVVFQLPRPGTDEPEAVPVEAQELRVCGDCGKQAPEDEFVGASERCTECFDRFREEAVAGLER